VLARKEFRRLKQEAYETFIVPIGDTRTNHLEERGNDMIQERVKQENSDSSAIVPIDQFYDTKYNYQSDCWIRLKFYQEFLDILFYNELKFQINRRS